MYKEVTDYLSEKNITYKTSSDKTEAIINCLFCEDTKFHLYVKNVEGCFLCHKCGARGSWKNLVEHLGDTTSPKLESNSSVEYTAYLDTTTFNSKKVKEYHLNLPERIRRYLKSDKRGLTDETIEKFEIGWDGKSIVIPVHDKVGNLLNLRHRRDPDNEGEPKLWNEKGGKASLFNIQTLALVKDQNPSQVLITEGEFDAMIAAQYGFPAVSSTAGAGTFKEEWAKEFEGIDTIYICYDTDDAGREGALRASSYLDNRVRIVELPSSDKKVDVTDYFTALKRTSEDFQKLLDEAKPPEKTGNGFELIGAAAQKLIHPTLDYQDDELYITFLLPVRVDKKETVKSVTITSSKRKAIVTNGQITLDNRKFQLRKVTRVPGEHLRWKPEEIQKFLDNESPISPALVFIEIKQVLQKFVDFRKDTDADILTLWIMGTYCFPIFDAFPYLYFVGVKRSGKTKTLQLIEKLAFNAILSSNISPAVLFRLVEAKRCTLALDEGEHLAGKEGKEKRQELQELLNSGYKRGAPAYRVRKSGKGEFEIEAFEIYGPKAIANISGLDNVLEDRAITITMVRTNNPDKGNLAVTEGIEDWYYLRSLLYSFALDYASSIAEIYHDDSDVNALINRQNELWRPLLSIAKIIDPTLPNTFERLKSEALRRAEETSGADLEDFDSAVLIALRELADIEGETTVTNKEIKEKAHEFIEEDQKQYLTSRGVGAALKRFGVRGKKIQGYWKYTVDREALNDLLTRYGQTVVDEVDVQ